MTKYQNARILHFCPKNARILPEKYFPIFSSFFGGGEARAPSPVFYAYADNDSIVDAAAAAADVVVTHSEASMK